ncbi:SPOR domain-containing protein [Parapontixanthobacter aurantiacus]|nr:SPOR domain-containing protein [Parapontixanthobacter aurantiacus]
MGRTGLTAIWVAAFAVAVAPPAVSQEADVRAGTIAWEAGRDAEAVALWREAAEAGDPDALFNLAQAYRLGRGVETDLVEAERLYALAASTGHLEATDNLGILLYQKGEEQRAMPYIAGAAERGDPRAQYLLGLAHFNGELAERDWQRAYALLLLADESGLPQATGALAQMNEYIPVDQREAGRALAQIMAAELAALSEAGPPALASETGAPTPVPAANAPSTATPERSSGIAFAREEVAQPIERVDPSAGLPEQAQAEALAPPPVREVPQTVAAASPAPEPAPTPAAPQMSGPWAVQIGAFGVPDNVERMWKRAIARSYFADAKRETRERGKLTFLYAGGFATNDAASEACAAAKRDGFDCIVKKL